MAETATYTIVPVPGDEAKDTKRRVVSWSEDHNESGALLEGDGHTVEFNEGSNGHLFLWDARGGDGEGAGIYLYPEQVAHLRRFLAEG